MMIQKGQFHIPADLILSKGATDLVALREFVAGEVRKHVPTGTPLHRFEALVDQSMKDALRLIAEEG